MKKVTNTSDYFAALPADQRAALEKIRKQILAIAPGAEEHLSYGLPAFKLNGHPLLHRSRERTLRHLRQRAEGGR